MLILVLNFTSPADCHYIYLFIYLFIYIYLYIDLPPVPQLYVLNETTTVLKLKVYHRLVRFEISPLTC